METTFVIPEHLLRSIINDEDTEDSLDMIISECSLMITQCQKLKMAYQHPRARDHIQSERSALKVRAAHLLGAIAVLAHYHQFNQTEMQEILNNLWTQNYKSRGGKR